MIVVSDHGEGLGEHELFDHGESLYQTEIRVPLLFILPSGGTTPLIVSQSVSLRDLPATIVDLVGLTTGSPFPGRSLANLWRGGSAVADHTGPSEAVSELPSPNPSNPNQDRSPAHRGPLVSLADGDFVYIRNQRDGSEELFNERDDPRELTNRARQEAFQSILKRFRSQLSAIQAQPSDGAK